MLIYALGTISLCSIASLAPPAPASPQVGHYRSLTIDGRPATLEEQQEFRQEVNTPQAKGQQTSREGN
jgi:hypothetical protein